MLDLIFNSERQELTETGFLLLFVGVPLLFIIFTTLIVKKVNKGTFEKVNAKVLRRVEKLAKKKEPRYQAMLEKGKTLSFSCYHFSWFVLYIQTTEIGCLLEVGEDEQLLLYTLVGKGIHSYDEPLLLTYDDIDKTKCSRDGEVLSIKLKGDKQLYKVVKNPYTKEQIFTAFTAKLGL